MWTILRNTSRREYFFLLTFLFAVVLSISFKFKAFTLALFSDEIVTYLNPTMNLYEEGINLLSPFNYQVEKMFGHPPLFPYLYSLGLKLTGFSIEAIRSISTVISLALPLSFIGYFWFLKRNLIAGIIAAVLIFFNISYYPFIHQFVADNFYALLLIWFLICRKEGWKKLGMTLGVLLPLARETSLFVAFALGVSLLVKRYFFYLRDVTKSQMDFVFIGATLIYFIAQKVFFASFTPIYFSLEDQLVPWREFAISYLSVNGKVYFFSGLGLVLILLWLTKRKLDEMSVVIITMFIVTSVVFTIITAPLLRYHAPLVSIIAFYLAPIICKWLKEVGSNLKKATFIIFIFIYCVSGYYAGEKAYLKGSFGAIYTDAYDKLNKELKKIGITENLLVSENLYNSISNRFCFKLEKLPRKAEKFKNIHLLDYQFKNGIPKGVDYIVMKKNNSFEKWYGYHEKNLSSFKLERELSFHNYSFIILRRGEE